MKLPYPQLSLEETMSEFDTWITPTLGDIITTDRFKDELTKIVSMFDILANATSNFAESSSCKPENIAREIVELAGDKTDKGAFFESFACLLFLVTGKSDNNVKCQLPIYLRDELGLSEFPKVGKTKKKLTVEMKPIPRTLSSDYYMKTVAALEAKEDQQHYMTKFVSFLLRDENAISQFWSIGHCYVEMKTFGKEEDLITPLVIFQVRGSVTASGGHEPEDKLRQILDDWGMIAGRDYNITDVIVGDPSTEKEKKTRAYDFVLPFDAPGWVPRWHKRLFIQCQFYAGDSGSVSHKNIDQVTTSRTNVTNEAQDARFIEYVDGAGYFSSLNSDLKKLLRMENTSSFFQLRSAPIRLRRELQFLGFLLPIEVESAILRTTGDRREVESLLKDEGYTQQEIDRCLSDCLARQFILESAGILSMRAERRSIVRRYFMIDIVAKHGKGQYGCASAPAGVILIPGYGAFYGLSLKLMADKCLEEVPSLSEDWNSPRNILEDIETLCQNKVVMAK